MYKPSNNSKKGDNGKLMIIGGSIEYHGAPMFSILSARRFVDLIYFYPGEKDSYLINSIKKIPEPIVVYSLDKVKEMDAVLFGIGIGNARLDVRYVLNNSKKLVIDGDGLKIIKNNIPKNCILTPHEGEFKLLFGLKGTKENVKKMASKWKCIILKKDPKGDIISDGKKIKVIDGGNSGLTKGGTGDILSGLVAAFFCKNNGFESCVEASKLIKKTADRLKKKFGTNYCSSDLISELAK